MKPIPSKIVLTATIAFATSLTLSCSEKCGGKEYNPETQFCRDNVAIDKCGGKEYDPAKEFCASDNVNLKCGDATYNPMAQFCDTRENKLYGLVTIGTQTWMAENLNAKGGKCYEDNPGNCDKYGMLYAWDDNTRDICPNGWRVPDDTEWATLIEYIGGTSKAGIKLKTKDNPRASWKYHEKGKRTGNGTDDYGFTAFPGGYGSEGKFFKVEETGMWWCYSKGDSKRANGKYVELNFDSDAAKWTNTHKTPLYSIRCIRKEALNVKCGGKEYNPSTHYCHTDGKTYSCGNLPYNPATEFCNSSDEKAYPMCEEAYDPAAQFCDSRDKKAYRFTVVGMLTWMAENLNYKTGTSWCYDNEDFNCKKFGRLYIWDTAKKACPSGWHLPTRAEWKDLIENGGNNNPEFSGQFGGYRGCSEENNCAFSESGEGYWWTATASSDEVKGWKITEGGSEQETNFSPSNGLSIRCVKNEEKKK